MAFRITYKATFSFGKLYRSFDKIHRETLERFAEESTKATKAKLASGVKPKLAPYTLKQRRRGRGWGGEKVAKTNRTTPLIQTGNLLSRIKFNKVKKSMDMPAYGLIQNKGFISLIKNRYMKIKYIHVPARKFITAIGRDRYKKTSHNKFLKKVYFRKIFKALKKRKV
jgi:hypothetical protein